MVKQAGTVQRERPAKRKKLKFVSRYSCGLRKTAFNHDFESQLEFEHGRRPAAPSVCVWFPGCIRWTQLAGFGMHANACAFAAGVLSVFTQPDSLQLPKSARSVFFFLFRNAC